MGEFTFVIASSCAATADLVRSMCSDFEPGSGFGSVESTPVISVVEDLAGHLVVTPNLAVGQRPPELFSYLNPRVVGAHAGWSVFHAGAVEFHGGALVLFGLSGAGKSTLTAALVGQGAPYLTDEATLVDPRSGLVQPYAKPLSLDHSSRVMLGLATHDADPDSGPPPPTRVADLGGRPACRPVPVRGLCHVAIDKSGPLRVERLRPADAIMALLPNYMCFDPARDPLAEVAGWVDSYPVWETSGEASAAEVAQRLRQVSQSWDPIVERAESMPQAGSTDPGETRSTANLGPFSAPSRLRSVVGVKYHDAAILLDRRTGEHVRTTPEGFDVVAAMTGTRPLREIFLGAAVEQSTGLEFVCDLADRGWLDGYVRQTPLPLHPHRDESAA